MRFLMNRFRWAFFVAMLLAACSPVSTPIPAAITSEATPMGASQPVAEATSRGDKLEASDPALVKYGAGRPVLIEFFRFT
jgi:hypothetical protein